MKPRAYGAWCVLGGRGLRLVCALSLAAMVGATGCGGNEVDRPDGGESRDEGGGNDTGPGADTGNDTGEDTSGNDTGGTDTGDPDTITPPPDMATPDVSAVRVRGNIASNPVNLIGEAASRRSIANAFEEFTLELLNPSAWDPWATTTLPAQCQVSNCGTTDGVSSCDYDCGQVDLSAVSVLLSGLGTDARPRNAFWAPSFCGLALPEEIAAAGSSGGDVVTNFYVVSNDTVEALADMLSDVTGSRVRPAELLERGVGAGIAFDPWQEPNTPNQYSVRSPIYTYPATTSGVTAVARTWDGSGEAPVDVYYLTSDLESLEGEATGEPGMFFFVPRADAPEGPLVFQVQLSAQGREYAADVGLVFPNQVTNLYYIATK